MMRGWSRLSILAIGLSLAACSPPLSSEQPLFSETDAVVPDDLRDIYKLEAPSNANIYFRFVRTGEPAIFAELVAREADGQTMFALAPLILVPIDGDLHLVQTADENEIVYVPVRVLGNRLRMPNFNNLSNSTRKTLAEDSDIRVTWAHKIAGKPAASRVKAYVRDLTAAAARSGGEGNALEASAVAAWPAELSAPTRYQAALDHTQKLIWQQQDDESGQEAYVAWARHLHERGETWGTATLAALYLSGFGVERDPAVAERLARRAVNAGFERAAYTLGLIHIYPQYGGSDPQQGWRLIRRAAKAGNHSAMATLAQRLLEDSESSSNRRAGLVWQERAAEAGNPHAQYRFARRLVMGEAVGKDEARAFRLTKSASDSGYATATAYLAWLTDTGRGTKRNRKKATQLYRKAASNGQLWAQWQLGQRYLSGTGIDRNLESAERWLQRSVDGGFERANEALERVRKARAAAEQHNDDAGTTDGDLQSGMQTCMAKPCTVYRGQRIIWSEHLDVWFRADGRVLPDDKAPGQP